MLDLSGSIGMASDNEMLDMLELVRTQKDIIMLLQRYEAHQMTVSEEINFFQYMLDAGVVWSMPSKYISRAKELINKKFIYFN